MLASFNPKNRELYARWESGIRGVDDLVALAAPNPQDVVVLERHREHMKSGLFRKKLGDGLETAGICLAQVGACAFLPVALTGLAPLVIGAGCAVLGGIGLLIAGILTARGYPARALVSAKTSAQDLMVFVRYQQQQQANARQDQESQARVAQATAQFEDTLRKVVEQSPTPQIVRAPDYVEVGGVRIQVRK